MPTKDGRASPTFGQNALTPPLPASASKCIIVGLQLGLLTALLVYAVLLGFKLCESNHEQYVSGPSLVGRRRCGREQFLLPGMERCRPWLTCDDLKAADQFSIGDWIGGGAVKTVYMGRWRDHKIVVNKLVWWKFGYFREKYRESVGLYSRLGPSRYINQYLGTCGDWHLAEHHPYGPSFAVDNVLAWRRFTPQREVAIRFHLCVQYVEILNYLHNSPLGTLVMCDSTSLKKTLSQYLVTADFDLVLNDVEDLKPVNSSAGGRIKCTPKELRGDFIAPEQRWPYKSRPFEDAEMPPYDEKTDIYKIPAVCDHFLGGHLKNGTMRDNLFMIHKRCKSPKPSDRPTTQEVLKEYKKMWNKWRFQELFDQY